MLSTDLLSHYRQLGQQLLTVVDVETTGHRPPESRVIEVSVLQATLADGIQHQQTHLINPQVPVPASITRFTGITQDMVNQATHSAEVWTQCLPLLNTGVLTAHNLAFDYAFLQSEFNALGISFVRPTTEQFCTVILARLMLPELPSRSLPDLVRHFGFAVGRSHRAEADTLACWLLAERLLSDVQTKNDQELLSRFSQQWLPLKEAAIILGISSKQAKVQLEQAGINPRLVGRYRTPLYQRGAIEQVFWQQQPSTTQLSWL